YDLIVPVLLPDGRSGPRLDQYPRLVDFDPGPSEHPKCVFRAASRLVSHDLANAGIVAHVSIARNRRVAASVWWHIMRPVNPATWQKVEYLQWPADWTGMFGRTGPLLLEIGFGSGLFLAALARS